MKLAQLKDLVVASEVAVEEQTSKSLELMALLKLQSLIERGSETLGWQGACMCMCLCVT